MSSLFQEVPKNAPKTKATLPARSTQAYIKLQGDFLVHNFGHYALIFIDRISQQALSYSRSFQTLGLGRILKQAMRKYMLSDLQLVHLGHILSLLGWDLNHFFIKKYSQQIKYQVEMNQQSHRLCFLVNLVSFFVKKYIGRVDQCKAIGELLEKETEGQWMKLYEQWLGQCPNQIFRLSPRLINQLYSKYSRDCQQASFNKNYNTMVDQIMELSTTYSMMPGEIKERKKKIIQKPQVEFSSFGRKKMKLNQHISEYDRFYESRVSQIKFPRCEGFSPNVEVFSSRLDRIPSQPSVLASQLSGLPSVPESNSNNSVIRSKKYRLGLNKEKEAKINHNVTDFFKQKNNSNISVSKKYNPQSMIGLIDPNPNFFDSKLFSSGEDIIPYTLRSNSNIFKSKLFQ